MKKVLALLAIVGFVACNNAEVKNSTEDSLRMADSIAKSMKDSVKVNADSAINKIDSTKKADKDSIKSK